MPNPRDICPRGDRLPQSPSSPHAPPIWPATVWRCDSPAQALALLGGDPPGFVYQRDAHPNADLFTEKCRELHGAECAAATSSGMAAMSLAVLSQIERGDHLIVSDQLYGRSLDLLVDQTARLGATTTVLDTCDLPAVAAALRPQTKLLAVETITNPLLRVSDIRALAELAHGAGALLLVDNTFASPAICRPLSLGADLVLESVSKIINGHSDVMLGLLCGGRSLWERVPAMSSIWGLASSPFDCWLAARGMTTLALRIGAASENALAVASRLAEHPRVEQVRYPGLEAHPDHALAAAQLQGGCGWMTTFDLHGGETAVNRFIAASASIPFCPSLGEVSTTLSHPASTSHRQFTADQLEQLGIRSGTIRLSVGIESPEYILAALEEALAAI